MGNSTSNSRKADLKLGLDLTLSIASIATAAYFFYILNESIAGFAQKESNLQLEKKDLARKLNRPELEHVEFSKHEMSIAFDVICPDDLTTSFSDVGGMDKEIDVIMDNVILPFKFWKEENERSREEPVQIECHVPGGMLMYGKPGTGKSMLAKAIAKEAGASFIGVKSGTILDKYVGESDKLVAAIFSLAQKIAPTVIFIDEVDTLLKKREALQSGTASSIGSMLGTLMAEWDGLNSDGKAPVIVLGATNRPMDIDSAFLRRMPLTIKTQAPDFKSRVDILTKMLKKEALCDDVNIELIAESIDGFTGSDIREICRLASISRMKAVLQEKKTRDQVAGKDGSSNESVVDAIPRSRLLMQVDFDQAIAKSLQDGQTQAEYGDELSVEDSKSKVEMATKWLKQEIARRQAEAAAAASQGPNGGSSM